MYAYFVQKLPSERFHPFTAVGKYDPKLLTACDLPLEPTNLAVQLDPGRISEEESFSLVHLSGRLDLISILFSLLLFET